MVNKLFKLKLQSVLLFQILTKCIFNLYPNLNNLIPCQLNDSLLGFFPSTKHRGHLGNKLFKYNQSIVNNDIFNYSDFKQQINKVFEYFQKYYLIPVLQLIIHFVNYYKDINKPLQQCDLNRFLHFDKLDNCDRNIDTNKKSFSNSITQEFVDVLAKFKIITIKRESKKKYLLPGNSNLKNLPEILPNNIYEYGSNGEKAIRQIFKKYNIQHCGNRILNTNIKIKSKFYYVDEYLIKIPNHRNRKRLDFVIFYNDNVIGVFEYDGPQHYDFIPCFHKNNITNFENSKKMDKLKEKYVLDNWNIEIKRFTKINTLNQDISKIINEYLITQFENLKL
jgi:hypothetical protein